MMLSALSRRRPSLLCLPRRRMVSIPSLRPSERPSDWKELAPPFPPRSTLFEAQAALPKLPVPDFNHTIEHLTESLKPIAWSKKEFEETVSKIQEFAKGQGPILHKRLLERNEQHRSWLEQWWDDAGYMTFRNPVVIYVTYYYGFDAHPRHLKQTPANRAAGIARGAMIFRRKLKHGDITPEATKEGPICMDSYRWMFDCCRVPGPHGADWSVSYAKEGDTGDSGHIIVFRKNRPWKLELTENGRILSTEEIEKQIQYIYDHTTDEYPGFGAFPANYRDVWAKDYSELTKSSLNRQTLLDIQSAAFVISLDTYSPGDLADFSKSLWHGEVTRVNGEPKAVGLRNRWADKPASFVVYDDTQAGIMGEHSIMDGTPIARMCDDVLDMLKDKSFDHGTPTASALAKTPYPLDWEVTPALEKALVAANASAVEEAEKHELTFYKTPYGKAAIKAFGVSPDSWTQMVLQLAYKRLIGPDAKRTGGTYESCSTRKFFKGRTETIRVVSAESDAWVESMDNPKATNVERKALFDKATKKHITTAKMCGNGEGFDRHLFGMKKLLKEGEPVPAMYTDPLYIRSSYWVMSTSAIYCKHFRVYGWGEVVPDGFGIPYTSGFDDRLQYTVTSLKSMPNAEFLEEIKKAADDLYNLHVEVQQQKKAML